MSLKACGAFALLPLALTGCGEGQAATRTDYLLRFARVERALDELEQLPFGCRLFGILSSISSAPRRRPLPVDDRMTSYSASSRSVPSSPFRRWRWNEAEGRELDSQRVAVALDRMRLSSIRTRQAFPQPPRAADRRQHRPFPRFLKLRELDVRRRRFG